MNAFIELRKQAAKKRNVALKLAEREYAATLRKIEELEQRFYSGPKKAGAKLVVFPGQGRPDGEMTLTEAICIVLRTHGILSKLEICVHVLEAGYQTTMPRRALSSYAGRLLRTRPHLFKREAGKWTLVG